MAPPAQALPVNHTPPKVSTRKPENLPVEPSTPIGPTTTVSTQEDHPNTRPSPTERVTRSGRVVKPPQRLDL